MSNRYLDKISQTRHCVNGVPMASAYECVFFNRDNEPESTVQVSISNSDSYEIEGDPCNQNDDGTYNRFDINLEYGEMSLYVDGVFKFGPIKGRATITLK